MAGDLYKKVEQCPNREVTCTCQQPHVSTFTVIKSKDFHDCCGCEDKINPGELYIRQMDKTPNFHLGAGFHLECLHAVAEKSPIILKGYAKVI